jgi:uncharacterized protein YggU (UPF0235/DUF167 family)
MLIEFCQEGIILTVRALPGAKRNEIRAGTDDFLKVSVTQIPEKGKANEAIRKQIIKSLNLRASQVEHLQGEISPQKKFLHEDEIRKTIEESKGQQSKLR